jgi:uncharacterized protein (TIGR03067 family)
MRRLTLNFAFAIAALACCRALAGDADDAKKLQGTWEVVELIAYGKKVDLKTIKGTKFVFAKDKLTVQPANDKLEEFVTRNFTFKLDPKKQPAEVDLTVLDAKDKGFVSPGIYELKGDSLRWCQSDATTKPVKVNPFAEAAPERPKSFASPEKSPIYLFTLKKVAK